MELIIKGHTSRYQVEQLQLALFGDSTQGTAVSYVHRAPKSIFFYTKINIGGRITGGHRRLPVAEDNPKNFYKCLRQSYYDAALPHLPEAPPWGAMAGVRPTKISTRHLLEGGTLDSADALLRDDYYVSPLRRQLALQCSQSSVRAVELTQKEDVSLYVGIPFCPTRCSYCSFVSRTAGNKKLLQQYLEKLLEEIALTGRLLREKGRTVRTVYIGGGTPTTLDEQQLKALLQAIKENVDLTRCVEYTVEGGRPDTLTLEKFRVMQDFGVNRLSINPQSMVPSVLDACKRPHSPQDVEEAYRQAQEAGFRDINMDLIAGLPTDTPEGFRHSLDTLIALNPTNITVHTLTLKKGADLFENRQGLPQREAVAQMVAYSRDALEKAGYRPYYLYKQKYMSASFENTGWSRDGRDCLYNIYMMEELHPIVSAGGGGSSKVPHPNGKLTRLHNPKFPEPYIGQFDAVLAQKVRLAELL